MPVFNLNTQLEKKIISRDTLAGTMVGHFLENGFKIRKS